MFILIPGLNSCIIPSIELTIRCEWILSRKEHRNKKVLQASLWKLKPSESLSVSIPSPPSPRYHIRGCHMNCTAHSFAVYRSVLPLSTYSTAPFPVGWSRKGNTFLQRQSSNEIFWQTVSLKICFLLSEKTFSLRLKRGLHTIAIHISIDLNVRNVYKDCKKEVNERS